MWAEHGDNHVRRNRGDTQMTMARILMTTAAVGLLAACEKPLDFDLRDLANGFDTSQSIIRRTLVLNLVRYSLFYYVLGCLEFDDKINASMIKISCNS